MSNVQWPCPACTFLNDQALSVCGICGAPNPVVEVKPAGLDKEAADKMEAVTLRWVAYQEGESRDRGSTGWRGRGGVIVSTGGSGEWRGEGRWRAVASWGQRRASMGRQEQGRKGRPRGRGHFVGVRAGVCVWVVCAWVGGLGDRRSSWRLARPAPPRPALPCSAPPCPALPRPLCRLHALLHLAQPLHLRLPHPPVHAEVDHF